MTETQALIRELQRQLADLQPLAIAVSGGVDSMTLAHIAHGAGLDVLMMHACSPSVPAQAAARVRRHGAAAGWRLRLLDAGEMEDADYLANPVNRCYFCKKNLYSRIGQVFGGNVASGTNTDDLQDYRPGLKAAEEWRVHHPFVSAGIDKATIRQLADSLGLHDLRDLPASPCLSSRITTGLAIDAELLQLVDEAERALSDKLPGLASAPVRCRVRPDGLVVQLAADKLESLDMSDRQALLSEVAAVFARAGRDSLTGSLELQAYEMGSAFIRNAT